MNRKILVTLTVLLAVAMMLTPLAAAKPVETTMVIQCNAQIAETIIAGNNKLTTRIVFGYFDSGPISGTINRIVFVNQHQYLKPGKTTVQNIILVTDAVVTIGDRKAVGEFEIKMTGKLPNVQWRITPSNLVDSDTGKSVNLNGQGTSAITAAGPPYAFATPFTPINYGIENTLTGKISLTP